MSALQLNGATSGSVTLTPPAVAGTNTLTLPAKTGNIITSADTGTVTQTMLSTNVAGNGPAFAAYQSSSQTISTVAKIQLQTKDFDTASCFDSSTNYRFTPNIAGYYQLTGSIQGGSSSSYIQPYIYKNGSAIKSGTFIATGTAFQTAQISLLVYLNGSTDYVELWASQSVSQALTSGASNGTYFQGFLARSA